MIRYNEYLRIRVQMKPKKRIELAQLFKASISKIELNGSENII